MKAEMEKDKRLSKLMNTKKLTEAEKAQQFRSLSKDDQKLFKTFEDNFNLAELDEFLLNAEEYIKEKE